jgi:hypothetical protein
MKLSKFILLFVIGCFVFQFANNSLLGSEVRLFPHNGEIYPGMESAIAWKKVTATIIYPIKLVLIGPLSGLTKLPDPPPPMILLAFALYWTAIALVIYFLFYKLIRKKK